ncbi:MAG: ExbD/TolR family protein [Polyangiales bacterium]
MAGTMGANGGRRAPIVGINVTPMIDVFLVLLIIMMVSATYIVSKSMKVDLPKAASPSDNVPTVAAVTITKAGDYFYNQVPVDEPTLKIRLHDALAANADVNLVVSGDKEAMHGKIVHVMDLARLEGITKFAINVESEK